MSGVLITRADRTLVSKQIEAEVRNYFGPLVYDRVVPASVKFREAYARGIPLIHYDRLSAGAEAYRTAAASYLTGRVQPTPVGMEAIPTESLDLSDEDSYLREAS
jgi:chromosome partitioning protein